MNDKVEKEEYNITYNRNFKRTQQAEKKETKINLMIIIIISSKLKRDLSLQNGSLDTRQTSFKKKQR